MENLKNFILKFWDSKFNKIWIISALLSILFILWGKKNRKFNTGIMSKVPLLIPIIGIALFLSKKWIVKNPLTESSIKSIPRTR